MNTHNENPASQEIVDRFEKRARGHKITASLFLITSLMIFIFLLFFLLKGSSQNTGIGGGQLDVVRITENGDTLIGRYNSDSISFSLMYNKLTKDLRLRFTGTEDSLKMIRLFFRYKGKTDSINLVNEWETNNTSQSPAVGTSINFDSWILKILISFLSVFLITMCLQFARYNTRLSKYYLARADALLLIKMHPKDKFEKIVHLMSPDLYHIGKMKFNWQEFSAILATFKEESAYGKCCCCCKCDHVKEPDKSDENKQDPE